MLRRSFLFIVLLLLASCANRSAQLPHVDNVTVTQTRQLGTFNKVYLEGNLNVSLHTGYSKPKVILKGAASDLTGVITKIVGGTLVIDVGEGYPKCGPITAIIQARYLNGVKYTGSGVLKGTRLNSRLIDFEINNSGSTILGGELGIRKLDVKGSGLVDITGIRSHNLTMNLSGKSRLKLKGMANISNLSIEDKAWVSYYWVNSKSLIIRARDESFVQLAGAVDKLDVELCDKAHFNGRYLRASRAFVKTFGHSLAEISAVHRQHTLASDSSDIHFYNISTMRTDFLAFDGAVLDMRDLRLPFIQEYDEYNKYTQM